MGGPSFPVRLAAVVALCASGVVAVPFAPATTAAADTAGVAPTPPDRIAFTYGTYEVGPDGSSGITPHGIGTIGFDGSDERVLTQPTGNGIDFEPRWSPDGYWLAFFRTLDDGTGNDQVVVMPRDGGTISALDTNGIDPSWSPAGNEIAWISIGSDKSRSLVVADVTDTPDAITVGPPRTLVTLPSGTGANYPKFSPDGTTISYLTWASNSYDDGSLFTVPASGGPPTQLAKDLPVLPYLAYDWSPDGTKLLFMADGDPDPQVVSSRAYIVNRDGSGERPVATESVREFDMFATWLPSGLGVGVVSNLFADGLRIFSLDGTLITRLASGAFQEWEGLTFSADGALAYTVGRPMTTPMTFPPPPPDLYAIPISGEPIFPITHDHSVSGRSVQSFDPGRALRLVATNVVDNALELSRTLFTSASNVVICLAGRPLDALAASTLAAALHAPLLLVDDAGVTPALTAEFRRLGATAAYTAGPVSDAVNRQLTAAGLTTYSVSASAYPNQVAAAVARIAPRSPAVLALSTSADTSIPLAAASYATARRQPLLFAGQQGLPAATRAALLNGYRKHVTLVAPLTIDPSVLAQRLRSAGLSVTVVRGNQYDVSARLAVMTTNADGAPKTLVLSSGATDTPSVSSAAAAAVGGGVNVLVPSQGTLGTATSDFLSDASTDVSRAWLDGSVSDVDPQVETQVEHLLTP